MQYSCYRHGIPLTSWGTLPSRMLSLNSCSFKMLTLYQWKTAIPIWELIFRVARCHFPKPQKWIHTLYFLTVVQRKILNFYPYLHKKFSKWKYDLFLLLFWQSLYHLATLSMNCEDQYPKEKPPKKALVVPVFSWFPNSTTSDEYPDTKKELIERVENEDLQPFRWVASF